jgi:hypothetical protein
VALIVTSLRLVVASNDLPMQKKSSLVVVIFRAETAAETTTQPK